MRSAVTASQDVAARPRSTRLPRPARRNQLLNAAQQVFVAQGYHAAAMDNIAERAGVSKPVLYQHFPSKLELYLALLDRNCDVFVQTVLSALASTTDNKQRVAAVMDAYFGFVADRDGAFRLVFESDLNNDEAVRERVERCMRTCAEAVSKVIAEDAGLPENESMLLAIGMTGMAQVAARYWLANDEGSIPRETAARLISTLSWRGIAGFPRKEERSAEDSRHPAEAGTTDASGLA
jgi:AcrR family transcriptional regulator